MGLSAVRRPGSGEINSGRYTYYLSGIFNGVCLWDVAISSKLRLAIIEVTAGDERIM